ncbi:MAG: 50S ribosomal protein L15 [Candidatus Aminicenantes bacterium RBG_13_62_12]|nr:MAG: 50S ribosomal protein L15 [Candidatus Aminicenantes bacterium RBG_13_62_12]
MKLNSLKPAKGSRKAGRRVGRGPGSGRGKTSGRGHKGQRSNAGFSQKRGFEGGQMPLHRRIPKRGFTNVFRREYSEVNLDRLERIDKPEIGLQDLIEAGLVKKNTAGVKVLGRGKISSAKTVTAHKFSQSAQKKIEEAGGKAVLVGRT